MTAQNERVKAIRKSLGLTMEEFGRKVGVTKQTVSKLENGINNVTDQMAKSICREFNVNYDYLMDGEGDMFTELPQTILDELCMQYECDNDDRRMIEEYLKLSAEDRKVLKNYIRSVFGK